MAKKEIEGDWVLGWPDRKRPMHKQSKDDEGRVIGARTPILDQEGLITPTDASYIVAQLGMPEPVHPDDFTVAISGEVERPGDFTLDDLRKLPGHSIRAVIECAGNDGDFFEYLGEGSNAKKPSMVLEEGDTVHWRQSSPDVNPDEVDDFLEGLPTTCFLSSGEWTGVPLAEVLNRCGLKSNAVAVRVEGWDRGRPDPVVQYLSARRTDFDVVDPGIINFDKGLPLEKALHPDTILAWSHNGEYLRHVHGAPLRLVVPGWAGNWWIKWIHKIEVMDHMPECYHQTHYFIFAKSPDDPDKKMMTAMGVKTLIVEPRDEDSPLSKGTHVVRGLAWSGEGTITQVEVSTDGGETWTEAHVEKTGDKWLWSRWSYVWEVDKPGTYAIMARATDEKGRRQPQTEWNFQRKHFDGIVPVDVTVE